MTVSFRTFDIYLCLFVRMTSAETFMTDMILLTSNFVRLAVKELCRVQFSIPATHLSSSQSFRGTVQRGNFKKVYFSFNIRLDSATLSYSVYYRGEEMGCEEVTYLESS